MLYYVLSIPKEKERERESEKGRERGKERERDSHIFILECIRQQWL